jgi:hypothetical protein
MGFGQRLSRISDVKELDTLMIKYGGRYQKHRDHFEIYEPESRRRSSTLQQKDWPHFLNRSAADYCKAQSEDHGKKPLEIVDRSLALTYEILLGLFS